MKDTDHYRASEERFVREAEAGSRMGSHPNLVTVLDLMTDTDGTLYLILEYVEGGTLGGRIADGLLPMNDALQIAIEAARGLQAAHEKGLVHRDIKPTNIFLSADGRAQIGDFGIAQIENLSARTHATTGHPGTPLYMSPEQSGTSGYVRPATDQYSLGLVLFEMLTGETYKRIGKREAVALLDRQPGPLRIVVETMLAQDPDDRYASMRAVADALEVAKRSLTSAEDDDKVTRPATSIRMASGADPSDTIRATPRVNLQPLPVISAAHVGSIASPPEVAHRFRRSRSHARWRTPVLLVLLLLIVSVGTFGAVGAKRNHDTTARRNRDAVEQEQRIAAAQQQHYSAAQLAITQEDFGLAATEFGNAGQFKDAPQRQQDAQRKQEQKQAYIEGRTAMITEEFGKASTAFLRAGTYKDAAELAVHAQALDGQQRQYQAGDDALKREDYTTAAFAFRSAGSYKDAQDRAASAEAQRDRKVAYDAGDAAFARGEFKAAKQQFTAAGPYKDAPARVAQADQEDMLLALYNSAQGRLKASQWREAYADLQQIQSIRPSYRDVRGIIGHLENDIANPTTIDLYAVLNSGNSYKRGSIPVRNLIGETVTNIVIVPGYSYDNQGRPDLISTFRVYLEQNPSGQTRDNTDVPYLAVSDLKQYRDSLQKDEIFVVVTGNGQIVESQNFGLYRAKLTVTNVATQDSPTLSGRNYGTDPVFTRLFVDVTLTSRF